MSSWRRRIFESRIRFVDEIKNKSIQSIYEDIFSSFSLFPWRVICVAIHLQSIEKAYKAFHQLGLSLSLSLSKKISCSPRLLVIHRTRLWRTWRLEKYFYCISKNPIQSINIAKSAAIIERNLWGRKEAVDGVDHQFSVGKKIDLLSGCERCLAVKKFFVWKSLCHLKTKATHDLKVFSRGKEALDVKITAKKYIEAIVIDAPAQVKRNFKLMIRRSPFSTLRKFDPRQLHESESL